MKILKWIIALPFIALALFVLARFALCRPSYSVVKTATPMVEKMADYIVKQGMPESLDDIPDLPYKLEDCKKNIKYRKMGIPVVDVDSKEKSDFSISTESCHFSVNGKFYDINFWFNKDYKDTKNTNGNIDIHSDKTSVGIDFNMIDGKLVHDSVGTGFDNRFGFCRQFRQ